MAIIHLQPKEVAAFWDGIKLAVVRSNQIPDEHYQAYVNHMLEMLLSGKLTAWVVFDYVTDNSKEVHALAVTSIQEDLVFGYKYVYVEALYGIRKVSDQQALDSVEAIKTYARNTGCKYIRSVTDSDRVKHIATIMGFSEFAIAYSLEV